MAQQFLDSNLDRKTRVLIDSTTAQFIKGQTPDIIRLMEKPYVWPVKEFVPREVVQHNDNGFRDMVNQV